ncbi:hypothetical protein AB0L88_06080 [Saccharopolyspora shandongensis]|uniref:hypothetical protein n=1 Tax=Saccharopolyspora shandongensis TaxID=418495 RepID=UPI00342408D8
MNQISFSARNGLLSDAMKPLRPRLRERYGERLEQLYTELEDGQAERLRELRSNRTRRRLSSWPCISARCSPE